MLAVSDLSKSYNLQLLFEKANFSLNAPEKIGLVGDNGCGKSTLLRILSGKEKPSSGKVHCSSSDRIGYLPQGFELDPALTFDKAVGRASGDPAVLEAELAEIARSLALDPENTSLSDAYDALLFRIQSADLGHAAAVLSGLDLEDIPPDLPVGRLSSGQQTRLALALLLLEKPDILLLDEPTNHLDIAMLEWMESWLSQSPSAALIVSHDRTFLDRTVSRILEIDIRRKVIRSWDGNYSDYLRQRESEFSKLQAAYSDQQIEIRRFKADIIRTSEQAASTERKASSVRIGGPEMRNAGAKDYHQSIAKKVARKAKAREKRLNRYLESNERVEKPKEDRTIQVAFRQAPHLGRSVIQLESLSVGFQPEAPLLHQLSLQVRDHQRIAITGPNGSGKTTLLRTLAGDLSPLAGRVIKGSSVRIGYLPQDHQFPDFSRSALQYVMPSFANQTAARYFLAKFLITGDDVFKPIHQLSLGQQARLAIAGMVLDQCNVLLLDEPINHLDIHSRSQFEQALESFKGTILAVLHDRYFIKRFADEVWQLRDGSITVRPG